MAGDTPAAPTPEEQAVRALLSALWQALQPSHFLIGIFVGMFLTVGTIALVVLL